MDVNSKRKIVEARIATLEGNEFQALCNRLCSELHPNDYTPVRAGGRKGDMKNDGYCPKKRIFFQAHATRGEAISRTKTKITEDLSGCLKLHSDVQTWVYLTNDTLVGDVENHVDKLRQVYSAITIETWGHERIAREILNLPDDIIQKVIDINLNSDEYKLGDEEEQKNWGIITDIFAYIAKTQVSKQEIATTKKNFTNLSKKIELNFKPEQISRMNQMISNTWSKRLLVGKYIKLQSELDDSTALALKEKIQSDFCTVRDCTDTDTEVEEVSVIETLANVYLEGANKTDPNYIANSKAIVLYFFEYCDLGKKTEEEKIKTKVI